VQATPTFFINGKKLEGALSLEQLDQEIAPLL
jgi:protein-disulfide isomerase